MQDKLLRTVFKLNHKRFIFLQAIYTDKAGFISIF